MSIMNNLKMAHAAIVLDQTKHSINPDPTNPLSGKLGGEVNKMAVEALTKGLGSEAWTEYMRLYASNEKELARLADVNVNDVWLKQQRAYIVSNAICDAGTQGQTTEKVHSEINLAEADSQPDAAFIELRKIKFPEID